jgi:hypothetical protein
MMGEKGKREKGEKGKLGSPGFIYAVHISLNKGFHKCTYVMCRSVAGFSNQKAPNRFRFFPSPPMGKRARARGK